MSSPSTHDASYRWVVAATLALCVLAVAEFTRELFEDDDVSRLDRQVAEQVVDVRSEHLTGLARAVTAMAGTEAILVVTTVGVVAAALGHRRSQAIGVVTAALVTAALVLALKSLVGRDRPVPPISLTDQATNAYPSGHAAFAAAVWGATAWVLVTGRPRRVRVIVAAATAVLVGMVGASRIYLGAHWTSDVVAGWAVGGIALTTGLLVAGFTEGAGTTSGDHANPPRR